MTTNEASRILREMILTTLDDDELAEMGEVEATYELRIQAFNVIGAKLDRLEFALQFILDYSARVDNGDMKAVHKIATKALKGGGDE